jgi:osmotically-inducible protein OsmY
MEVNIMVANGKLYTTVMEKLHFEPRLDSANITVAIQGNHDIIVLDGKVKSFAEKLTAESVVKTIQGVKAIVNEIKVDPSLHYKKTDSEIATDTINALKSSVWVPAQKIKVLVKDGAVTLAGEVEWQYEKTAAFTAVKNLWGIKSINNEIIVKPSLSINEDKVRQEITKEFERHARFDASRIKIKVQGRKITLEGEVSNFDEMEMAEDAAWAIPGVAEVRNELVVD